RELRLREPRAQSGPARLLRGRGQAPNRPRRRRARRAGRRAHDHVSRRQPPGRQGRGHQAHSRERSKLPADRRRGDALHQVVAAERTWRSATTRGAGSAAPRVGGGLHITASPSLGSVAMLEHDLRLSRRRFVQLAGAGGAVLLVPSWARGATLPPAARLRGDSVVVRWNQAALQGVREPKPGPPMGSRALAIVQTCVYDAWAAYDRDAVGTRLGGSLRRPTAERTRANKMEAISVAAYRAAVDLFPASRATVFDPLMASLGYDPGDLTTDPSRPPGVGNLAAHAVLRS